jgi:hypothetical protein
VLPVAFVAPVKSQQLFTAQVANYFTLQLMHMNSARPFAMPVPSSKSQVQARAKRLLLAKFSATQ